VADIPWTWLAIRGSGLTAWALLTAVVVWGLLLRTRLLGRFAAPAKLLDLHRWLGALALAFLGAHLALLMIDPAVKFTLTQILIPGTAPWQTTAVGLGTIAFWVMIPVAVVGRLRHRMGKAGNVWFKRSHLIAYAAWPLATAHYVLAGTDALAQWSLAMLFTGITLVVTLLLARGFVPAARMQRPPQAAADTTAISTPEPATVSV
jgi:predicted ferric reductase